MGYFVNFPVSKLLQDSPSTFHCLLKTFVHAGFRVEGNSCEVHPKKQI